LSLPSPQLFGLVKVALRFFILTQCLVGKSTIAESCDVSIVQFYCAGVISYGIPVIALQVVG